LNNVQSLSRDSIKPRQLFPRRKDSPPLDGMVDDDAPTDTEEKGEPSASPFATPMSPEFPQAPGATRLTRSSARGHQVEDTPTANASEVVQRKRISPFDQWLRKKQKPETVTPGQTTPQKRSPSPTAPPTAKKTRSSRYA